MTGLLLIVIAVATGVLAAGPVEWAVGKLIAIAREAALRADGHDGSNESAWRRSVLEREINALSLGTSRALSSSASMSDVPPPSRSSPSSPLGTVDDVGSHSGPRSSMSFPSSDEATAAGSSPPVAH